jgi:hypothetical protein
MKLKSYGLYCKIYGDPNWYCIAIQDPLNRKKSITTTSSHHNSGQGMMDYHYRFNEDINRRPFYCQGGCPQDLNANKKLLRTAAKAVYEACKNKLPEKDKTMSKMKDLNNWSIVVDTDNEELYIVNTNSHSKVDQFIEEWIEDCGNVSSYLGEDWDNQLHSAIDENRNVSDTLDDLFDELEGSKDLVEAKKILMANNFVHFMDYKGNIEYSTLADLNKVLNNDEKGEKKMSKENNKSVLESLKSSAKIMGDAALTGVKLSSVELATNAAYEKLKVQLIKLGIPESIVDDSKFKEGVIFMLPIILHPVASAFEDKIPQAKYVKNYAELAITGNVQRNSTEALKFLFELFQVMAAAGGELVSTIRVEYKKKNMQELRIIAKERNLRVPSSVKKDELVQALQEDDASKELSRMAIG